MSEAKHRRQRQPTGPAADLGRVFSDGQGLAGVEILMPSDTPRLIDCLRAGDPSAHWRGKALVEGLAMARRGAQCLLCGTKPKPTADSLGAIAIVAGELEHAGRTPTAGMISLVCVACVARLGDRVSVTHAVRRYYLRHFDVRALDNVTGGGEGTH